VHIENQPTEAGAQLTNDGTAIRESKRSTLNPGDSKGNSEPLEAKIADCINRFDSLTRAEPAVFDKLSKAAEES